MAVPGDMTPDERRLADVLHKAAYLGIEHGVSSEAALGCLVSVIAALINTQYPPSDHDQIVKDIGSKGLKNAVAGFAIYAAERRRREAN